ncbi:MAG: hypothetical protein AB2563_19760 [Candidatus Thiodiazotropha endolucinida]
MTIQLWDSSAHWAPFYMADREDLIRTLRSTRREASQDAERSESAPKG